MFLPIFIGGVVSVSTALYFNSSKPVKNTEFLRLVDQIDETTSLFKQLITADKSFLNNIQKIRNDLKDIENSDEPLKIVMSTNGGALFNCSRLIRLLRSRGNGYTLYVRKYCMSAGTLIALGATEIIMLEEDSFLGKIDPQISIANTQESMVHIIKAGKRTNDLKFTDLTKILKAEDAENEINEILNYLQLEPKLNEKIKNELIYSSYPHEHKFDFQYCKDVLGLPVRTPLTSELHYFE